MNKKVGDKTTTISSIAADVTEATGNVTITVTYVPITPGGGEGGGDDIIPGKPSKPDDHKPGVPDKTPDKPIIETPDDTEVDTTPKDQDLESGPAAIKGYKETNAPLHEDMNNAAPARGNNSISSKGADIYAETNALTKAASVKSEEKGGKHELPQTGEKENTAGIFGILVMVLGFFGLADRKKKKDE